MHDDPRRRVNGEGDAVGHAVRDADELDLERSNRDPIARPDGDEAIAFVDSVLLQLRLDQRQRQRRRVNRTGDVRQHVWYAADVILVTVREDQRGDMPPLLQIRQVRDDQIDAQELRVGEHDARVHDDGRVTPGECEHVHAELAEPAERYNFEH